MKERKSGAGIWQDKEKRRAEIERRWGAGESLKQISDGMGVTDSSIGTEIYIMREIGTYSLPKRGELRADSIAPLWAEGLTGKEIALKLGISKGAVSSTIAFARSKGDTRFMARGVGMKSPEAKRGRSETDARRRQERLAIIMPLFERGESLETMGKALEPPVTRESVRVLLESAGLYASKRAIKPHSLKPKVRHRHICLICREPFERKFKGSRTCSQACAGKLTALAKGVDTDKRRSEIERLWNEGKTLIEIAEALGTRRVTVATNMHRMRQIGGYNLPIRYDENMAHCDRMRSFKKVVERAMAKADGIAPLWAEGLSMREIGERLGMKMYTVQNIITSARGRGDERFTRRLTGRA